MIETPSRHYDIILVIKQSCRDWASCCPIQVFSSEWKAKYQQKFTVNVAQNMFNKPLVYRHHCYTQAGHLMMGIAALIQTPDSANTGCRKTSPADRGEMAIIWLFPELFSDAAMFRFGFINCILPHCFRASTSNNCFLPEDLMTMISGHFTNTIYLILWHWKMTTPTFFSGIGNSSFMFLIKWWFA